MAFPVAFSAGIIDNLTAFFVAEIIKQIFFPNNKQAQ
jgi:hypothetical protein